MRPQKVISSNYRTKNEEDMLNLRFELVLPPRSYPNPLPFMVASAIGQSTLGGCQSNLLQDNSFPLLI
ncbi:hypothetical protein H5410_045435 [Solanum commersonii]|uniref:Uncharacterized protein n=1 Tax=Solanum commersonii TaxID=4109 RepID=A0A9J5X9I7_SOLCO|nr:hypothetical protein H5410_045435 [Solanum commersonii]